VQAAESPVELRGPVCVSPQVRAWPRSDELRRRSYKLSTPSCHRDMSSLPRQLRCAVVRRVAPDKQKGGRLCEVRGVEHSMRQAARNGHFETEEPEDLRFSPCISSGSKLLRLVEVLRMVLYCLLPNSFEQAHSFPVSNEGMCYDL
jgi:hypothetical protein